MGTWQKSMPCTGGQTQGVCVCGWGRVLSFCLPWAEFIAGRVGQGCSLADLVE